MARAGTGTARAFPPYSRATEDRTGGPHRARTRHDALVPGPDAAMKAERAVPGGAGKVETSRAGISGMSGM